MVAGRRSALGAARSVFRFDDLGRGFLDQLSVRLQEGFWKGPPNNATLFEDGDTAKVDQRVANALAYCQLGRKLLHFGISNTEIAIGFLVRGARVVPQDRTAGIQLASYLDGLLLKISVRHRDPSSLGCDANWFCLHGARCRERSVHSRL